MSLESSFSTSEQAVLHEKLTRMNIVLQQELEELNDQCVDIYV